MITITQLIEQNLIQDGFPLSSSNPSGIHLDGELKDKVDSVINEFGKYSGYHLEVKTLEMLGVKPYEKSQYFGQSVDEILKKTKASN